MSKITQLRPDVKVPDGSRFIERFDHDGVEVTIVENLTTHRYQARFVDRRPVPFTTISTRLQDVKRKAIQLIDKLHGNK